MAIKIEKKIGTGGFASVYRGLDTKLNRAVAVKIVRASVELVSNALDHAKALARANHANVATVYGLDNVEDPDTGQQCEAVIMELIEGPTLEERLGGTPFRREEVRAIGFGLIEGLAHIHDRGATHEDLHRENVLIAGGSVKIIDMILRTTLKSLGTGPRRTRIARDLTNLRDLLHAILAHSDIPSAEGDKFIVATTRNPSIKSIRLAFTKAVDSGTAAPANTSDQTAADAPIPTVIPAFTPDAQYRAILRETAERLQFDKWESWISGFTTNGQPSVRREALEALDATILWLLRRPWPGTRRDLESAFLNLRRVASDLVQVFNAYAERGDSDVIRTRTFYYDERRDIEDSDLEEAFEAHVDLVQDLAAELTRAANWLCEVARSTVDPAYFLEQGWLTLTTGPGDYLRYETFFVRYRTADLPENGLPYSGLRNFIQIRTGRDRYWGEDHLPRKLRYLGFPDIHKKDTGGNNG